MRSDKKAPPDNQQLHSLLLVEKNGEISDLISMQQGASSLITQISFMDRTNLPNGPSRENSDITMLKWNNMKYVQNTP